MVLQPAWSYRRSPEMDERGRLVRDAIPAWLEARRPELAAAIGIPTDDLLVKGRDGTGRKTRIPWVRFGSRTFSPSATEGFYVVYLFDARGDAVYLSLNQGTTNLAGGDYKPKPRHVVRGHAEWGRATVAEWLDRRTGLTPLVLQDRPDGLGRGYEAGDIASVRYAGGAVPNDGGLLADVLSFAEALGVVYEAQGRDPLPFQAPEVELAEEAAAVAAGKRRRARGAGFSTNAEEIRIVEQHAVDLATAHYEALGWDVDDVGRTQSYDLDVRRPDRRLHVEVKGTTSDGELVTLTDAEVRLHARVPPDNALVVVRRIALDRSVSPPIASGGELREIRPWHIDPARLRPIAHRYTVPEDG
jgi:hypothetical protein